MVQFFLQQETTASVQVPETSPFVTSSVVLQKLPHHVSHFWRPGFKTWFLHETFELNKISMAMFLGIYLFRSKFISLISLLINM